MTRYVALLRAINVGGRTVKMAELEALVGQGPYEDLSTYLASGNVLLTADATPDVVARDLERRIADSLNIETTVIVRTAAELAAVLQGNPFADRDVKRVSVAFLSTAPKRADVDRLLDTDLAPDEVAVVGTHAYLHTPEGFGRSKLGGPLLERALHVPATVRSWNTTAKLAELVRG